MQASSARTIGKEEVGDWLGRLIAQAEVIAPTPAHGRRRDRSAGSPLLSRSSGTPTTRCSRRSRWCCRRRTRSSRSARNGGGFTVEPVYDERPRVLFGVRSCDVKGIDFLNRMHANRPRRHGLPAARRDADLGQRGVHDAVPARLLHLLRRRAVPAPTAFDVQLTDLGDRFLAEVGSEKGARSGRAVGATCSGRPAAERGGAPARARGGGEASVRPRDLPLRLGDAARLDRPGQRRAVGGDRRLVPGVRRLQLRLPDLLLLLGQGPGARRALGALPHLGLVPVPRVHPRGLGPQPARGARGSG